jgi:hypothetical protein
MSKIKASDIARYLTSDVVEFDKKKKDWIYMNTGFFMDNIRRALENLRI